MMNPRRVYRVLCHRAPFALEMARRLVAASPRGHDHVASLECRAPLRTSRWLAHLGVRFATSLDIDNDEFASSLDVVGHEVAGGDAVASLDGFAYLPVLNRVGGEEV